MGEATLDLSGIEFVNETERDNFIRARLGIEVEDFLRSTVGKYLHQRAKIDFEEAKDELYQTSLSSEEGREKALALQAKARMAHAFMKYLGDAIQDGFAATKALETDEQAQGD